MRCIKILLLLFIITTARGQLNYEGNPLTENTDYTAEESHYSKRNDPSLSSKFNEHNVKIIDSYVAAANSLIHDRNIKKTTPNPFSLSSINTIRDENNQLKETNDNINVNPTTNVGSLNYQVPSITLLGPTSNAQIQPGNVYTTNQRHDNTNEIQIAASRQIPSVPSKNDALNYFLKSETPEESQLALEHYLYIHNQNQQTNGQLERIKIDNEQNLISSSQNINQQLSSDIISNGQSATGTPLIPNSYPIDQQIHHVNSLPSSSSAVWQQIPIQNRRDFISPGIRPQRPLYHYYGPGVGRPYRGRQRLQTRIGHGHYPSLHPPTSFIGGGGGGKPPGELIYTRPPGFHGPPGPLKAISNPPTPYEDASAHFPDSDHPPVDKNIYYSQLYSQSYDPYYYNYIAKTGKIKPWLYGKLGPNEDSSFWNELLHSFKNHGMKNILNPMFLLGLSIPAVTLMLSAMVNKRSFDGRSIKNFNQSDWRWSIKDLEKMQANIMAAIECMSEQRTSGGDPVRCTER